jgi:MinD-like ATPase involved in chromosome partitioning or flagellar assembly
MINPSQIDSVDYLKKNAEYVSKIIEVAKKSFDFVIVDTIAGMQNPVSKIMSAKCDLYLNVLTQNPYILDWFKVHGRDAQNSKCINIINMYEDEVYPDSRTIKKEFDIDNITLAYSKTLKNYYNQRNMIAFYSKKDIYNDNLHNLTKLIIDQLNIKGKLGKEDYSGLDGNEKKGLFNIFK